MSVTAAAGFRAAGAVAGLKPSGKPDVALVVNDGPRRDAAAVFTSNRCKANPVLWSERTTGDGKVDAVVLNSGGANCYNGPEGFQTTHASAELVAELIGGAAFDVAVCSTGLIGPLLDRPKLEAGIRAAAARLSSDGGNAAATAIMTTDTRSKEAVTHADGWTVGGMAKGAGMLAPGLATMLVVITTDAVADPATLDAALRTATRTTFDRVDTDGCMSTNDTVLLMSSGASGVTPDAADLASAVTAVCADLTKQLWTDAEGAHHDIEIAVAGAATEDDAVAVGRSIARSNLFKAAVFGKDPNWGRVLAAVGTTDAVFEPERIFVSMNGVQVCRAGGTQAGEPSENVDMSGRHLLVEVDLGAGDAAATVFTSDLTHDYVHENSAYST
ncbi:bifunctional glutamate N-acetyltransferase/amino-acid acetyltransferase ArgJ [Phytoactinopolyspora alkaliphila]|uniref:Arginine biosynthesis bifunctional protein ArgJ n=1 Tax=Phytoactinopolyspora alkaliphila TaxID=1783498 RepID=A0A6N9YTU9_9ACTN|nr:bifunctional glutamate N-acetyltransferase/amino-acid acetyltransferase ArgJ [Phytoactinopolyspora alkaliphila]NED98473.1 bifunctional glutamate N-acetyltransferase/amino-acid acetyltransferase ArgJ [Phytoactinopolyspora alkaliphila]